MRKYDRAVQERICRINNIPWLSATQLEGEDSVRRDLVVGCDVVSYEVVADLLKKKNPWDPLLDIYEKGLLIRGYKNGILRVLTRCGSETLRV